MKSMWLGIVWPFLFTTSARPMLKERGYVDQATSVELNDWLEHLIVFTYPDAAVKSPHSDDVTVVFGCWLWCTTVVGPKLPMPGKEAGEFVVKVLLGDAGDAPEPGGGASLGATPPGGGGITFRPPPPKRIKA